MNVCPVGLRVQGRNSAIIFANPGAGDGIFIVKLSE